MTSVEGCVNDQGTSLQPHQDRYFEASEARSLQPLHSKERQVVRILAHYCGRPLMCVRSDTEQAPL
jgi:hypothetical protein